jgi:hypothetical protein
MGGGEVGEREEKNGCRMMKVVVVIMMPGRRLTNFSIFNSMENRNKRNINNEKLFDL